MSVNFLNLEKVESQTIRPVGYKFPKGLSHRALVPAQEYSLSDPASHITTSQATKSETPTYVSYTWTTTGSFEQSSPEGLVGDLLIVAGGGAGQTKGAGDGGHSGGGAGGLLYYSETNGLTGPPGPASANSKSPNGPAVSFSPSVVFTVTVGGGGTGAAPQSPAIDAKGGDSSVANTSPDVPSPQQLNLIASGGGSQVGSPPTTSDGGSGAGGYNPSVAGTGTSGQGNPGGTGGGAYEYSGGGGGGAGGVGCSTPGDMNERSGHDGNPAPNTPFPGSNPQWGPTNIAAKKGFTGGDGLDFDISGTRRTYGAGGAGSGRGYAWPGGSNNLGGRGSGLADRGAPAAHPWSPNGFGGSGVVNRGSGGGGGGQGGNGGSGVVIMKFTKLTDFEYVID